MPQSTTKRDASRSQRSNLGWLRNRHFIFLDICALCITPIAALFLRVETLQKAQPYFNALLAYMCFALVVRLVVFYATGLYSRYWQYATADELVRTFSAVLISTIAVSVPFAMWGSRAQSVFPLPRSLPLIDGLLVLFAAGASRFSVRLYHGRDQGGLRENCKRALIVGAGMSGQLIVKDLRSSPDARIVPVAFLDDDPGKQNLHILNLPVLGGRDSLPKVVKDRHISHVIIAMPSASGKVIREYLGLCEKAGVSATALPAFSAIANGRISINRLRKVEIEDLLRREPIETDTEAIHALLCGKRVMVTGGGGSIGGELCHQILKGQPSDLAILGHGENSVFDTYNALCLEQAALTAEATGASATQLHTYVADIRFAKRISAIVKEFRPDIIFHAAAHKHVPLMEANPGEAISNNVFGTKNVLEAAMAAGVDRLVMISTDKAVNPTSVMGASKRAAEFLVLRAARVSGKKYVAVRFGNVLGSRGSVVPTFRKQIAMGGPITVTHPEMTRYFMTIPEAVQLVLQASVLGNGGEVFMMDMGEPVKIVDLARDLVKLSGLELHRDIDIQFTGLRPGEKLTEELFLEREDYERMPHVKLYVARNASETLPPQLMPILHEMEQAVFGASREQVLHCLQTLIPEFQPDESRAAIPLAVGSSVVGSPVVGSPIVASTVREPSGKELAGLEPPRPGAKENGNVKAVHTSRSGEPEHASVRALAVVDAREFRQYESPTMSRSDAT